MEAFVYGTLTDPDRAGAVLGANGYEYRGRAVLRGLHRVDGRYPTLTPGGSVEGRILSTARVDALDRYEGVEDGLYVRVSVPLTGGSTVETYVGEPDRLDAPAGWPGEGTFAERVRRYLGEPDVVAEVV